MNERVPSHPNDADVLGITMDRLAEAVLDAPEAEIVAELGGTEAFAARAQQVRALLWTTAKTFRQQALLDAIEEYQRQVKAAKEARFTLPSDPAARRDLLVSLFQRSPQIERFTLQHRDFKTMSDADVDSVLKQLQALGALPRETE